MNQIIITSVVQKNQFFRPSQTAIMGLPRKTNLKSQTKLQSHELFKRTNSEGQNQLHFPWTIQKTHSHWLNSSPNKKSNHHHHYQSPTNQTTNQIIASSLSPTNQTAKQIITITNKPNCKIERNLYQIYLHLNPKTQPHDCGTHLPHGTPIIFNQFQLHNILLLSFFLFF